MTLMLVTGVLRLSGLVLLLVAVGLGSAPSARTQILVQSGPMVVTTDTPEYCQELLLRVADLVRLANAPVPREVTDLTSEGQRMCDHGQTRGGIMRVRSALMMLEKGGRSTYR